MEIGWSFNTPATRSAPAGQAAGQAADQTAAVAARPGGSPAPSPAAPQPPLDPEGMAERLSEQISQLARDISRALEFQVRDSGQIVILVKDRETGETIRAIPPEELQRLAETLDLGRPTLIERQA